MLNTSQVDRNLDSNVIRSLRSRRDSYKNPNVLRTLYNVNGSASSLQLQPKSNMPEATSYDQSYDFLLPFNETFEGRQEESSTSIIAVPHAPELRSDSSSGPVSHHISATHPKSKKLVILPHIMLQPIRTLLTLGLCRNLTLVFLLCRCGSRSNVPKPLANYIPITKQVCLPGEKRLRLKIFGKWLNNKMTAFYCLRQNK
jgi:hypothetical protein